MSRFGEEEEDPKETDQVEQQMQVPSQEQMITDAGNQPICSGITKNIFVDRQRKALIGKWFRALFSGVPIFLDNDITMFQVYPDCSGHVLNALGNACDQVIVYGKVNYGAIVENNDVEVYGYRDSNNNVVAKMIQNKATGTTIRPKRMITPAAAWVITLVVLGILFCIFHL